MKAYKITVNGITYDVTVEDANAQYSPSFTPAPAPAAVSAPAAPVPSAPAAPSPTPKAPAPSPVVPADGTKVTSPMPGTILKTGVQAGDRVKKGDVLLVLEAMKMENEIVSPCDGTVVSLNVEVGASANAGDILVVIA